jgi:hypothetical protein
MTLPVLAFAASPLLVFAAYPGNVDGIVCGALGWSFAQARSRPMLAGALAAIAAIKPQVGVPLAVLIILFHSARPLRSLIGAMAVAGSVFVATLLTTGPASIEQWLAGMQAFQRHITVVPDLTSSAGLYAYATGPAARSLLSAMSLLAIGIIIAAALWYLPRSRPLRPSLVAPLWLVVAFLTPFAHYHDFAVVALPFAMIWQDAGPAGRRVLVLPWLVICAGGSFLVHPAGFLITSVMMGACCALTVLACTRPLRRRTHMQAPALQVA